MLNLVFALAAATVSQAPAAPPATPAAAVPSLTDIPGVTVKYYDVTGKKAKDFRKSITEQRPKGADGLPLTVGSKWTINAGVNKRTEAGVCKIEDAKATFTATVELPRLASTDDVPAAELANWNSYAASLGTEAAARLAFVQSQLGSVEQAIKSASCEGAGAALQAATDRIKAQETALAAERAAQAAATEEAKPKPKKRARDLYRGTTDDSRDNGDSSGY